MVTDERDAALFFLWRWLTGHPPVGLIIWCDSMPASWTTDRQQRTDCLELPARQPKKSRRSRCVLLASLLSSYHWLFGLVAWFSLRVREVLGSIPRTALCPSAWRWCLQKCSPGRSQTGWSWDPLTCRAGCMPRQHILRQACSTASSQSTMSIYDTCGQAQQADASAVSSAKLSVDAPPLPGQSDSESSFLATRTKCRDTIG